MAKGKNKTASVAEKTVEATVEKAEVKSSKPAIEKVTVKNLTPYHKVDPDSGTSFKAYAVVKNCDLTGWLKIQIDAKLFELVG